MKVSDSPLQSTSIASLRHAVLVKTAQHPLTLYPTAVGLLGVVGTALFGVSGLAVGVAAGGIVLGMGHFATQFFLRGDRLAEAHLREMHRFLDEKKKELLQQIEQRLEKMGAHADENGYGDQAIKQLHMIQARFAIMQQLLLDKFNEGELTYTRYYVAGEQAFTAVLDNLSRIESRLSSVSTIDMDYHKERLHALHQQKTLTQADHEEIRTLEERKTLRDTQLDKVNVLLTFNERAVTEFDRVNTAIAEIKGVREPSSVDLDSAMRELETLAARAHKLST